VDTPAIASHPDSYLTRACPTCGAAAPKSGERMASAPPAESLPFNDLRSCWRGFFRDRKPFFTYVRCASCGQLFSPNYFTPAQLDQLYSQMDDNTGGQDEALLVRAQRGYWQLLQRDTRLVSGDYLELGPDIGLFTREALAEPALEKFWLIEPNTAVHPALDRLAGTRPHAILADHARLADIPDGTLSLAVAIHVLDHLLDPQPLLEQIARKLKPGGCVLAVTHSERSLAARAFGARWPAYCLQHPQLYAPATLQQAFERAGLRNVHVARSTNYFPVPYLLQHGLFAAGLGRHTIPLPASWVIGLKLGNIAAVGVKA
jgi:SAM-dependent methyltransferase